MWVRRFDWADSLLHLDRPPVAEESAEPAAGSAQVVEGSAPDLDVDETFEVCDGLCPIPHASNLFLL